MFLRRATPLLILLLLSPGPAQSSTVFPEDRYRELREEVRFLPPAPREQPGPANPADWDWLYWPTLVLLSAVSVGGLAFLGYRSWHEGRRGSGVAEAPATVSNRNPAKEETLPQDAPEELLRLAEAQGSYDLAARLLFLDLLAELQRAGTLVYRRDFSNREYLRQLADHPLAVDFGAVTAVYERGYYGGYPLDRLGYRALHHRITALRQRLSSPPTVCAVP
ncbi:hypothetical protein GGR26_003226 [Lewinella marina]|uniref:Protein-glutamine gamma-glutamyltransferase-like C-terminal domain-containing protein n=1 Tax=Neolewinella marina TaxID=438751 RepID=A0A2G0CE59_9BACT|nr:DUF4129 domain-containing protein [Neolewinella marina]NJB87446.1 hypothetical protein [Neolewinella marina]PHK98245.1 hypothetical protein CGL56_11110 [Neolewinella marina]